MTKTSAERQKEYRERKNLKESDKYLYKDCVSGARREEYPNIVTKGDIGGRG